MSPLDQSTNDRQEPRPPPLRGRVLFDHRMEEGRKAAPAIPERNKPDVMANVLSMVRELNTAQMGDVLGQIESLRQKIEDLEQIATPDRTEQPQFFFPFRVTVFGNTLYCEGGYRCAVGASPGWQSVASTTHPVGSGGLVYMKWVYSVADEEGEITTPGYWDGGIRYASAIDNSSTQYIVRIATVTDGVVTQEQYGNATVIDMAECQTSE